MTSSQPDCLQTTLIFGYGSIIWRPCFPFVSRRAAYVRGFVRRFWQISDDHRGTCEKPGVVCCVIPVSETAKSESQSPDNVVHGVVFEVSSETRTQILEELDRRERNGYVRDTTPVYDMNTDDCIGNAFIYVCDTNNPGFRPEWDIQKIASQIATAVGPSGTNAEYILKLRDALKHENINDFHIEELVAELAPLLDKNALLN